MIVPFVDEGLGNSSYLVDLGDGRALTVDAVRDPSGYLDEAARRSVRIAFAADTHLHADFVTGARELAAFGATVIAPVGAGLGYAHRGLRDGEELDLGGLVLRALATPGHTPEHVSYLLVDAGGPVALFSGGALIVGSVARTDLISRDESEPLARAAYRSVRERLGVLPDALDVLPTHGAGSFCSAGGGRERMTTIGRERTYNPAFRSPSEDAFVRDLFAGLGSFPPYFLRLREVNRCGPAVHGRTLPTPPVVDAVPDGAVIVDVRPFRAYCRGHVRGSISIEMRPAFASWLGWVVDQDRPLVFVLDADQDRAEVVRQCLKIGYENIAGEVDVTVADVDVVAIPLVDPLDARRTIVDVRQRSELSSGRIPGAVHAEVGTISEDPDAVPEGHLTIHCGHGQRAATAASLLERAGRSDVSVMVGGPDDWSRAHRAALVVG